MESTGSIGIFDSGVGGLTVVKALMEKLPEESFIYFGDTANVPYGNKTREQLFYYAERIISFLLQKQVRAIMVACGTHSSVTLPVLEGQYDIPMLGVVKAGARAAARTTRNGRIGVIATAATISSHAYAKNIKSFNSEVTVFENACSKFVPLVEAGKLTGEETRQAVAEYLAPLIEKGIDTLVLGCTHYPFLEPVIQDYVGEGVKLVNPAYETVDELAGILEQKNMRLEHDHPERKFFVSGNDESFFKVGKILVGDILQRVDKVDLE
ncbi:MAG: glutamate racemase [Syntrophomonadaceae bacterium]